MRAFLTMAAVGGLLTLAATPALADRIDGNWCSGKGTRIAINGARITTPAGNLLTGNYTRHAFSYVAPQGDMGDGQTVLMRLLSDEYVQIQAGATAKAETWQRCNPEVS